jgi:hypothetical protein
MLRVVLTIDKHHDSSSRDRVSTRRLLQDLAFNEFHLFIKEAAAEGYIKRLWVKKPNGQGAITG